MFVKVIKTFHDLKDKCLRYPGNQFEADADRVEQINATGAGILVVPVEEPKDNQEKTSAETGAQESGQEETNAETRAQETSSKPKKVAKPK